MKTRRFVLLWALIWTAAVGSQVAIGVWSGTTYVNEQLLFVGVAIAASLCAVFSVAVIVRAFRENSAESALLGCFLTAVAVFPLAHGFLTPGVLYGPNPATTAAAQLAVPVGGLTLLPLLRRSATFPRWRAFAIGHVTGTTVLAVLLLVFPQLPPAAETGSIAAIALAALALAICFAASSRHLRLAIISQHWHAMTMALGFALIGSAPLVFVVGGPYGAGFWFAHLLDVTGVLLVAGTAVVAFRRGTTTSALLAPIDAATPLRSLEVGLDPLVHRFVGALDDKDEITREHVVRTARLAVLVATELRLPPMQIRNIGLAAILHDVGKLDIPDEILKKPGKLTDAEFDAMKEHTVVGYRMVQESTALQPAAPFVRGHHERVDGRGYPDQLSGSDIPFGARIVAACDAYDAMSHTRQYREGMDRAKVVAILREHQGSQWDAEVIDALIQIIGREAHEETVGVFSQVGRDDSLACCHDALPV